MHLKKKETQSGYDPEEYYFEKLNRELINKIKNQKKEDESESNSDNVIPLRPREQPKKKAAQ